MKACLHSCPTPEATLADNSGKLNKETLGRDPEFKKLLEAGWQWTVVSSRVEQRWPSLPRLAERALNSSNEAFLKASELELLLYLGEHAASHSALQRHEVAAELTKPSQQLQQACCHVVRPGPFLEVLGALQQGVWPECQLWS